MKYGMAMPRKYIQGDGVLSEIADYAALLGERPLVVWGKRTRAATAETVAAAFAATGTAFLEWPFCGESSLDEANQVAEFARENNVDSLIGLGGGKAIDTAKGVAAWLKVPVMIVPTIAATDAPITQTSGWYDKTGQMVEIFQAPFNPDILLVDTGVIARAPLRLFIAGMGDGITTCIEADASYASRTTRTNRTGGLPTMATRTIAKLCMDTLLEDGVEAVHQVRKHLVTPAVERVVESLVLHSGLGGESGGIAAAHSIANNLPYFKQNHAYYHGENVAFGVMTQLFLDDSMKLETINKIAGWMRDVGLPITLEGIGLQGIRQEELIQFAQFCIDSPVSFFDAMVCPVTTRSLVQAMLAADDYGHRMLSGKREKP